MSNRSAVALLTIRFHSAKYLFLANRSGDKRRFEAPICKAGSPSQWLADVYCVAERLFIRKCTILHRGRRRLVNE